MESIYRLRLRPREKRVVEPFVLPCTITLSGSVPPFFIRQRSRHTQVPAFQRAQVRLSLLTLFRARKYRRRIFLNYRICPKVSMVLFIQ